MYNIKNFTSIFTYRITAVPLVSPSSRNVVFDKAYSPMTYMRIHNKL
jgi:hypothetical protein